MAGEVVKKPIEPEEVFATAEAFHKAAGILSAEISKGNHACVVPQVVNSCFALELYLKCLLSIEGCTIPLKHDLDILYANLPRQTKQQVSKLHDELSKDDPHLRAMEQFFKTTLDRTIDGCLKQAAKVFDYYRYHFEYVMNDHNVRIWFPRLAVRQIILKRRPEFEGTPPPPGQKS